MRGRGILPAALLAIAASVSSPLAGSAAGGVVTNRTPVSAAAAAPAPTGSVQPVSPARLLDTRAGIGAATAPLPAGQGVALQVTGRGGIPASGVAAVVLNVTVTAPTRTGYLTAYPDGSARPTASNLNFVAGQTIANLVLTPVGPDGKVDLYNGSAGSTQVIADVSGYVLAAPREIVQIVGLTEGYCALLSTGGVDCWGYGGFGALGNGSFVESAVPVSVKDVGGTGRLGGVVRLTTNGTGVCGVLQDGGVDCWGQGIDGELGNGAFANSATPVAVSGVGGGGRLTGVVRLSSWSDMSGSNDFCAVLDSGGAACWGFNLWGSLGNGTTTNSALPVAVKGVGGNGVLSGVQSIASTGNNGYTAHCALLAGGKVACWGYGFDGELGNGVTVVSTTPVAVKGVGGSGSLSGVTRLRGASNVFCAVLTTTGVNCWGRNVSLGNGSTTIATVPVTVSGVGGSGALTGATDLASASDVMCAPLNTGEAACWGQGLTGSTVGYALTPVYVSGLGGSGHLGGVQSIGGNIWSNSCAVLTSGGVDCWGDGLHGGLGDGSSADSAVPVVVSGIGGSGALSGVTAVTGDSGGFSVCAARTSAVAACWGLGLEGELGNGTIGTVYSPVAVSLP